MSQNKRAKRGEALYHAVMVRLAEDHLLQLDFLCARWNRARGTLARQLIVDGLSEILNTASPLHDDWLLYREGRRPAGAGVSKHPTAKQSRLAQPEPDRQRSSEVADMPHIVTLLPAGGPQS